MAKGDLSGYGTGSTSSGGAKPKAKTSKKKGALAGYGTGTPAKTPVTKTTKPIPSRADAAYQKNQVAPTPNEAVLSFGQSAVDTLSTLLYGVTGGIAGAGKIVNNIITGKPQNITPVGIQGEIGRAAIQNATTWVSGGRPLTSFDLLKNIGVIGGKGALIQETKSTGDFWKDATQPDKLAALAGDILLDPTTYVGFGLLTKVGKGALLATKSGIEAAKMASAGKVAVEAVKELPKGVKLETKPAKGVLGKPLYSKDKYKVGAQEEAVLALDKAGVKPQTKLQAKQLALATKKAELKTEFAPGGKANYQFVDLGNNSSVRTANAIAASALNAAKKEFAGVVLSVNAKKSIETLSRQTSKLARKEAKRIAKEGADPAIEITATAAVQGAKAGLQMEDGSFKKVAPNTVFSGPNGEVSVFDGEKVFQFKTKKDATAWLKNKKVPEAEIQFDKGVPKIDTAPSSAIQTIARLVPEDADAKYVETTLKALDKVARTIKPVGGNVRVADRVMSLVKNFDIEAIAAAKAVTSNANTVKGIQDALAGKEFNPILFLRSLRDSSKAARASLYRSLSATPLTGADGAQTTLGKLIEKNALWSQLPEQSKSQLNALLRHILDAGSNPAGEIKKTLASIEKIAGKEVAKAIADSRALETRNPEAAIRSILGRIPGLEKATGYRNIDELINGLANQDVISIPNLEKIFKALDPESKLGNKLAKAMTDTTGAALKDLFLGAGVQTIRELQNKMKFLDPKFVLTGKGLANADALGAYYSQRLAGVIPPDARIVDESLDAAATNLTRIQREGDKIERDRLSVATGALSTALNRRAGDINAQLAGENFQEVSKFLDAAIRDTEEVFQENTHAILLYKANQSFEAILASSVAGLIRSRGLSKIAAQAEKTGKLVTAAKAGVADTATEFAQAMRLADETMLAIFKNRIVVQKYIKDTTLKGAEKLKEKYYMYFHSGDVVDAFLQSNSADVIRKVFFPPIAANAKKADALEFLSVNNGILEIFEALEKGVQVPSREKIVERFAYVSKSRVDSGKVSQLFYSKGRFERANELYDALMSDPKILEYIKSQHLVRAMAHLEDSNTQVMGFMKNMFEELLTAQRINSQIHGLSKSERIGLITDAFNRFVFLGNFLDRGGSDVAVSLLKLAGGIFLKDGKIIDAAANGEMLAKVLPNDAENLAKIFKEVNGYWKHVKPASVAPAGREGIKFPTKAAKEAAQAKLTGAMKVYESIMREWDTINTPEALADWTKRQKKAQSDLDKARKIGWEKHLDIKHWDNGKWVDHTKYNFERATKRAEKLANNRLPSQPKPVIDTITKYPVVELSASASKAYMAKVHKALRERAMEEARARAEDAATQALEREQEMLRSGMNEYDLAYRMHYESIVANYAKDAAIPVEDFETLLVEGEYSGFIRGTSVDQSVVFEQRAMGNQVDQMTRGRTFTERLSGSSGREQTGYTFRQMQSKVLNGEADLAGAILSVRRTAKKLGITTREGFIDLLRAAQKGEFNDALGPNYNSLVRAMQQWLEHLNGTLSSSTIEAEVFEKFLKKYGLTPENGVTWKNKSKSGNLQEVLDDLPFGENPFDKGKNADKWSQWEDRKNRFMQSDFDPFELLSRISFAHAHAQGVQKWAADLIVNHGVESYGWSLAKAKEEGFVAIKAIPGQESELIDAINRLPNAVFPPEIAQEIGSMARELAYLESKGKLPGLMNSIGKITGAIKATLTILRPGHIVTNIVGDFSSAIIGGTIKPTEWIAAARIARAIAKKNAVFDYGFKSAEEKMQRALGTLIRISDSEAKDIAQASKMMQENGMHFIIGGKAKFYTFEDIARLAEDNGIATESIVSNDIQGMVESLQARVGETGERVALKKRALYHLERGYEGVVKVPGDFTAFYSNIPRLAHAMSVARKGAWKNEAEMVAAMSDRVHLYHPTVLSLAATERKNIRPFVTFYTWLRVAHNAMIDMAMNHTGAMLAYPKFQYQMARGNENEPRSFGDAWGATKQYTPGYLNFSTYAPVTTDQFGLHMAKPSFLAMDVLDTWNWTYDPSKTWDENIASNSTSTWKTLGKSSNIIFRTPVELLSQTDLDTGQKLGVTDAATFAEQLANNLGFMNLAVGLGLYTPINKRPENTSKPLTDRERELKLQNWMFGLKQTDVTSGANLQNAKTETADRIKRILERQ